MFFCRQDSHSCARRFLWSTSRGSLILAFFDDVSSLHLPTVPTSSRYPSTVRWLLYWQLIIHPYGEYDGRWRYVVSFSLSFSSQRRTSSSFSFARFEDSMNAISLAGLVEESVCVETITTDCIYRWDENLTIATERKRVCLGFGFTPFSCFKKQKKEEKQSTYV